MLSGLTVRSAIRTRIFWFYALALTAFLHGFSGWQVHAVPYYESIGISSAWAAGLVAIGAGGAMVGRIASGITSDRLRSVEAGGMVLIGVLALGFAALLLFDGVAAGIAIFVVSFAIGSGGGPLLEPLLLTRTFGVAKFASIFGIIYLTDTIGIVVSPTVAGALFDATGSYDLVLVMLIASFVLALLFLAAARLPHPELSRAEPLDPVP